MSLLRALPPLLSSIFFDFFFFIEEPREYLSETLAMRPALRSALMLGGIEFSMVGYTALPTLPVPYFLTGLQL